MISRYSKFGGVFNFPILFYTVVLSRSCLKYVKESINMTKYKYISMILQLHIYIRPLCFLNFFFSE